MPLGPEYIDLKLENRKRLADIAAMERSVAGFAVSLLPDRGEPRWTGILSVVGAFQVGTAATPYFPPQTETAYYRVAGMPRGESMAAFYSAVGCLFTRNVTLDLDTRKRTLGPLSPRAAIFPQKYEGYHVLPIDQEQKMVCPADLALDDREAFVDDVAETLALIGLKTEALQRV